MCEIFDMLSIECFLFGNLLVYVQQAVLDSCNDNLVMTLRDHNVKRRCA